MYTAATREEATVANTARVLQETAHHQSTAQHGIDNNNDNTAREAHEHLVRSTRNRIDAGLATFDRAGYAFFSEEQKYQG